MDTDALLSLTQQCRSTEGNNDNIDTKLILLCSTGVHNKQLARKLQGQIRLRSRLKVSHYYLNIHVQQQLVINRC